MKKVKGVYTVEAAIIIPMVLFTMTESIHIGIDLYMKTERMAADVREVEELEDVELIHKLRSAGNIVEALKKK